MAWDLACADWGLENVSLTGRFSGPERTERLLDGFERTARRSSRARAARAGPVSARAAVCCGNGCGRRWPRWRRRSGLFLALSWAGLWLGLPPLGRAIGVVLFAVLAIAAAIPLLLVRLPSDRDGLRRLDRSSGEAPPSRHRHRRRDSPPTATIRWRRRSGALMSSARCYRPASSRRAGRSRDCRCAIRWRCARSCYPGVATLLCRRRRPSQAHRRRLRLAGRGGCRRISASTPG